MMGPGMMGGWGFLSPFPWILVIAGIVVLVVWLVRRVPHLQKGRIDESAMDILKRRYASGEISREEYEEKRKLIS